MLDCESLLRVVREDGASAGIEVGGPGPGSFEIGGQALTTAKLITQLSNWALPYSI